MNEQEDKKIELNLKPLGIQEFTIFLLKRNIVTVLYHFQIHGTNYDDVFKAIFRCRKIRNKVTFLQMGRFFFFVGAKVPYFFSAEKFTWHSLTRFRYFFFHFPEKKLCKVFFFQEKFRSHSLDFFWISAKKGPKKVNYTVF